MGLLYRRPLRGNGTLGLDGRLEVKDNNGRKGLSRERKQNLKRPVWDYPECAVEALKE